MTHNYKNHCNALATRPTAVLPDNITELISKTGNEKDFQTALDEVADIITNAIRHYANSNSITIPAEEINNTTLVVCIDLNHVSDQEMEKYCPDCEDFCGKHQKCALHCTCHRQDRKTRGTE